MTDTQLVRKLVLVVLLKLLVLGGLWWAFVREARVAVDAEGMASTVQHPSEKAGGNQENAQ